MRFVPVGFLTVVLLVLCAWDIVSFLVLPVAISTLSFVISLVFGRFEMTLSKSRNASVVVVATLFLSVSILFSIASR